MEIRQENEVSRIEEENYLRLWRMHTKFNGEIYLITNLQGIHTIYIVSFVQ